MSIRIPIISEFDGKGIDRASREFAKLEGAGAKTAFALKKAFLPAVAAVGGLTAAAVPAIKAASDLNETVSKSNVIFGRAAKEVQDFAKTAARSLGQSENQALNAASTFAVFGKSAGLAGQDLSKFAIDFTELASDMASFNNTSPEQAIQAIGAALRGESEPIRQYGVLLSDAVLKQEAMNLGIYDGNGALTAQQKVLAAQAAIFKQTNDAQGDFARTSDGLANQTKILTAELENAKTKIGESLLPVVLEIMPHLVNMAGWVSENTDMAVKLAGAVGGLAAAITIANLGLKAYNITAGITRGVNYALAASFNGAQLSAGKMGIAVGLLGLTLSEFFSMMKDDSAWAAFTTFAHNSMVLVNNTFFAVANQIANAVTILANGAIQIANVAIAAINRINPFANIEPFTEFAYRPITSGFMQFRDVPFQKGIAGPSLSTIRAEREGNLPNMGGGISLPNIIPPTGAGSAAGTAARATRTAATTVAGAISSGGLGSTAFSDPLAWMTPDTLLQGRTANVTVNVNGGLATSAEIGEAVVNSIRQYNQMQGPANIAVA